MSEAYLDGNAGMPLRPEARAALLAALDALPGNPSSAHAAGRRTRRLISEARERVAALVGAAPRDVVFTSGGTESNVLAVRGALAAAGPDRRALVTTRAEHPSLARLADRLEREGVPVRRAATDAHGRADSAGAAALVAPDVALVSFGLAQSVTGAVQDLDPVAEAARAAGAVVHTDAAQAAGRVDLADAARCAHLVSLSAAKIGGPPGVGALVIRAGAPWTPPHGDGSQEAGRRPGTEALPLIAAFGAAADAARADRESFTARCDALLAPFRAWLAETPGAEILSPPRRALANTILFALDGCPGDALLAALDAVNVRVSTGTACTSLARTPAEVLVAGGIDVARASRAVRVSLSWNTSAESLTALVGALRAAAPRVRSALATS